MNDEKTRKLLRILVIALCIFALIFAGLMIYYFPIKDRIPNEVLNYTNQIIISSENQSNVMFVRHRI